MAGWRDKLRPRLSAAWSEARRLLWARRGALLVGLALLLVGRAAGLVLPATSKYVVDEVIAKERMELLPWLVGAALVGSLVSAITSFLLSQILGVTAQLSVTQLRQEVEQHIIRLPVSFFEGKRTGELISRVMNDAEGITHLVGSGLVRLVGSLVTGVLALAVLIWLDWRLTLATVVMVSVFASVLLRSIWKIRPIFRERNKVEAEISGRLGEGLSGVRVVKAYTAEKREDRFFAAGTHRLLRVTRRTITAMSSMGAMTTIGFGILSSVMMLLGTRAIASGRMTLGDLVMYLAFTGFLVAPMVQMASLAMQAAQAFAGLDRIREVRALETEVDADSDRQELKEFGGELAFDRVSFAYGEGPEVLHEIDFVVPQGKTTALVGVSGAGKSTVFRLAMGFDDPTSGRVLIDGRDLRSIRRSDYRRWLSVVLQDEFLFDGSILENIGYSRPAASREEIERVGRLAHCAEFVEGLEDGYETVIGERGVRLSGGQRQRVAIARALLADPRLLLLDEATSNLDSESEMLIQDGLSRLREGRTTLVIAHRLSTVRSADQILVLEEGRVVERGTHLELIESGGRYSALWRRQSDLMDGVGVLGAPPILGAMP